MYDGTRRFADVVHFVTIYVIDPHPAAPDPSPYSGSVWETPPISDRRQPRSWDGRATLAREVRSLLTSRQTQLVDDLTPGGLANPFWCTYGTAPNAGYVIRRDGTIATVQTWFDATAIESVLRTVIQP
jgi:hypothetical protein